MHRRTRPLAPDLRLPLTLAAALWGAGPGCSTTSRAWVAPSGVPAGSAEPGTFGYTAGRSSQTFAYPVAAVKPAVVAALEDLKIGSVRQGGESTSVVLEGLTPDGRRAAATLHPLGTSTRVTSRVGAFGDEAMSRALMDRVGVRLGALPPSAVPTEVPSSPGSNPYFSRSAVPDEVMLKDAADAAFRGTVVP